MVCNYWNIPVLALMLQLFSWIWILLISTAYLVAEGGQIGGRFLPDGPDLRGWDQSEDVLDGGGGVGPELIPEGIVRGFDGLQDGGEARV